MAEEAAEAEAEAEAEEAEDRPAVAAALVHLVPERHPAAGVPREAMVKGRSPPAVVLEP